MTPLEVLNKAIAGLESQNWQLSRDDNKDCYYRHSNGLRCAAGWLIPDSLYSAEMEGRLFIEICEWFNMEEALYITYLQELHDGAETPEELRDVFMGERGRLLSNEA